MEFFKAEEFHQMIFELTESDVKCYDTLVLIAKKTLYKTVCQWCNQSSLLRGYEDDIMQEIYLRLIKKCVTGFLMRNGELNDDPNGFKNWLFTVAKNIRSDFAKNLGSTEFNETKTPDGELPEGVDTDTCGTEPDNYDYDELNRYFGIVLGADSNVHIPLTWLTVMLMITNGGMNRIEATEKTVSICSDMELDAMFDFILAQSDNIIWLELSDEQIEEIRDNLDKTDEDGIRTGEKKYCEFYMKKGAKASVSDWVNRMNSRIIKEVK